MTARPVPLRVALLAVLALLLGPLSPATPAHAADGPAGSATAAGDASISGSVVIPPEVDNEKLFVDIHYFDTDRQKWMLSEVFGNPAPDGSFTLDGLEEGVEYRLALLSEDFDWVGGFYAGPGLTLVRDAEDGAPVLAPSSGYSLALEPSADITGVVTFPEGFEWDETAEWVVAEQLDETGEPVWGSGAQVWQHSEGQFRIKGLRADSSYAIRVYHDSWYEGPDRYPSGYFHAGVEGLVESAQHATPVPGGSSVELSVGSTYAVPRLSKVTDPRVTGSAVVGRTLAAEAGRWSLRGVSLAYEWLRGGTPIAGATGPTYTLSGADAGAKVAVRVTASVSGFADAVATSASLEVAKLAAPRATRAPRVSGTARLGSRLTASAGAWDVPGATLSLQWLREGKAISGARKSTYTLTTADVGKRISVRVTAKASGRLDGAASSSTVKVAKGKPKVTASTKSVKATKRATVKVKVRAAGLAKLAGTVTVRYGKKSKKVKLRSSDQGKVSVKLPKLKKGRYTIKVSFKPTGSSARYIGSGKATNFTLRVR